MTTLFPGINFPSFSAASTIAFAILSFTEPPAEKYSTLPTTGTTEVSRTFAWSLQRLTEVTLHTILLGNLVESDEGGLANSIQCGIQDLSRMGHLASSGCVLERKGSRVRGARSDSQRLCTRRWPLAGRIFANTISSPPATAYHTWTGPCCPVSR